MPTVGRLHALPTDAPPVAMPGVPTRGGMPTVVRLRRRREAHDCNVAMLLCSLAPPACLAHPPSWESGGRILGTRWRHYQAVHRQAGAEWNRGMEH